MTITKEAFAKAAIEDKYLICPVPEWGIEMRFQTLSIGERNSLLNVGGGIDKKYIGPVYVLLYCAVDDEGKRLFTDKDLPILMDKDANVMERLCKVAMDHAKLGGEAVEEAKKNCSETQT
ncbi:hypothetical protein [Limnoglobus roseus]|uniref:Uncharacterized protein n=1 Tax=Limnoglobus roseus TaxID=2598579 RepID=A0A5C1AHF9_9BACT|nr:hypothetical protein [Limnoglobus roseus]QEL16554.1 hypothetical protein PX52LOC_03514 [Limnoglobus roseus]